MKKFTRSKNFIFLFSFLVLASLSLFSFLYAWEAPKVNPPHQDDLNLETLNSDKTLIVGKDKTYQLFSPGGDNRIITLDRSKAFPGARFVIKNTASSTSSTYLEVQENGTTLEIIYPQGIKEFVFDGNHWVSLDFGTQLSGEENIFLGNAKRDWMGTERQGAYDHSIAMGYMVEASYYSIAAGYYPEAHQASISIDDSGSLAYTNNYSVDFGWEGKNVFNFAVGAGMVYYPQSYGVALGKGTEGWSYGVGIGSYSYGENQGVGVGYYSIGHNSGVTLGYKTGSRGGVLPNYAGPRNILIGAFAGENLEDGGRKNIIIGYKTGLSLKGEVETQYGVIISEKGNNNILIGFEVDTPSTSTSNFLNLGNLIFATGINATSGIKISPGQVGIGTYDPSSALEIVNPKSSQPILTLKDDQENLVLKVLNEGKVGVKVSDPKAEFEVDGMIRVLPRSGAVCNSQYEGAIYYDANLKHLYGCNGTS
ncbi:MAG TPA: hypothetical protein ENG32_00540, partial [bacterium]|nr:hypothetical protein [bacterium]